MKRILALDIEEYNALVDMANAHGTYMPSYQTINFSTGFYYVFDAENAEAVEKILILGARAGLVSP